MKPKQFIKYTQMLDKKGLAICDGMSYPDTSMADAILTLAMVLGFTTISYILLRYKYFKTKKK